MERFGEGKPSEHHAEGKLLGLMCQGTCTRFKALHVSKNISCTPFERASVSSFKRTVQLLVLAMLSFTVILSQK